jgi:hypothetical protein
MGTTIVTHLRRLFGALLVHHDEYSSGLVRPSTTMFAPPCVAMPLDLSARCGLAMRGPKPSRQYDLDDASVDAALSDAAGLFWLASSSTAFLCRLSCMKTECLIGPFEDAEKPAAYPRWMLSLLLLALLPVLQAAAKRPPGSQKWPIPCARVARFYVVLAVIVVVLARPAVLPDFAGPQTHPPGRSGRGR